MATLVLSTVGSALGGPVGGAIGSLVGQSIDQQIFAPASRGPRLGDLAVQTSSYGTQIPRLYGTMRVAGSVIWSTDLVESSQLNGAKGQPDETFSYSVSFAVALSSRPLIEVRRIWADGKLLRGEAGDFKVPTEFRFYDGSETQIVDPLIGSIEGLDATPAYRGLAMAVFENLELGEYGNRLPFLTFEVVADLTVTVGAVLNDAAARAIDCDMITPFGGYAATGRSMADAITPLVEAFAIDLVDAGGVLRSPVEEDPIIIAGDDLGSSADGKSVSRREREQAPASSLPASILLTYYDPERDYQIGQARSDVVDQSANEDKVEVAAVMAAGDARSIAEQIMARRWAQRDRLLLRLPPRFIHLQPGTVVSIPDSSGSWQVTRSTIDGMAVILELRPVWRTHASVAGEAGRALAASDVVMEDVTLALIELPDLTGRAGSSPTLYLAATTPAPAWKRLPVEISSDQFAFGCRTAGRKAMLGVAVTVLADGETDSVDMLNSVEVQLIDQAQWLTSCDDEALAAGANLALIGDELLQFSESEAIGPGHFRLTGLLRGRFATESATATHANGEMFVLIERPALQAIALPAMARGATVTAAYRTPESSVSTSRLVDGRSLPRALFIDGEQVVGGRLGSIPAPAGGAVVDVEARTAMAQILAALRTHGLIEA
jgi:hypothetical protein